MHKRNASSTMSERRPRWDEMDDDDYHPVYRGSRNYESFGSSVTLLILAAPAMPPMLRRCHATHMLSLCAPAATCPSPSSSAMPSATPSTL